MKYRMLGQTSFYVSEVGFGTWGLGGDSYGAIDEVAALKVLNQALDRGINFYDTSDLYGAGRSEELLGKAFAHRRDQVIIASKFGTLPHTGFIMPQDFTSTAARKCIDQSLRRLKSDYIDIYQLHSPPIDLPNWGEIIETLTLFKQAGKIRAFGLSARSPSDAKKAVETYGLGVIQVNFNLIDHRAVEIGLFDLCQKRNVGVIARTPLAFGYLSGKLNGSENFSSNDHRANWSAEQLHRWANSSRLFTSLNNGCTRSLVGLALLFCLSTPCVSTVIPGMMKPDEVEENATISDLPPLTLEELEKIKDIYENHVFYDPTVKQEFIQRYENKP